MHGAIQTGSRHGAGDIPESLGSDRVKNALYLVHVAFLLEYVQILVFLINLRHLGPS